MNGILSILKNFCIRKREYHLRFDREDKGLWYYHCPNWPFDHHNLLMVGGADKLCAFMSDDNQTANMTVIPANTKETHEGYAELIRKEYSIIGGATYEVKGLEGFERNIWICPVTLTVLGRYPKYIYFKKTEK